MSQPFVGEIKLVGFSFAPRGYAFCQGALLPISQNAALFSLLGTTFGGNGQTTFQLPNFGGRVPVGQGQSPGTSLYQIGQVAGTENVTILASQMPMHTHALTGGVTVATTVATVSAVGDQAKPGGYLLAKGKDATSGAIMSNYSDAATDSALGGVSSTASSTLQIGVAGGSQPTPIMQPYLGTNYIIATVGIFPSRN